MQNQHTYILANNIQHLILQSINIIHLYTFNITKHTTFPTFEVLQLNKAGKLNWETHQQQQKIMYLTRIRLITAPLAQVGHTAFLKFWIQLYIKSSLMQDSLDFHFALPCEL